MKKDEEKPTPQPREIPPLYIILALAAGPLAALLQAVIERGNVTAGGINILLALALGFPMALVGFFLRVRRSSSPSQKHTAMILLLVSLFFILQAISYPIGRQIAGW